MKEYIIKIVYTLYVLKEGKNMDITKVLEEQIPKFMKNHGIKRPIEINAGRCKQFSSKIKSILPEVEIMHIDHFYEIPEVYAISTGNVKNIGKWNITKLVKANNGNNTIPNVFTKLYVTPFHQWIYYKGKHYDAEEIHGVRQFL